MERDGQQQEVKKGKIIKVYFFNKKYAIFDILNKEGELFNCKGHLPEKIESEESLLQKGIAILKYRVEKDKFGTHIVFNDKDVRIFENPLKYFLVNLDVNLSEKEVLQIISVLKEKDLTDIFLFNNNEKKEKLREIISDKKIEKLEKKWRDYYPHRNLFYFLSKYNADITLNFIDKILKILQEKKISIEEFKKNPYILTELKGIGFKRSDSLVKQIHKESDGLNFRIKSYIEFLLKEKGDKKGDTVVTKKELEKGIIEHFKINRSKFNIDKLLQEMEDEEKIVKRERNGILYIGFKEYYEKEKYIYEKLKEYSGLKNNPEVLLSEEEFKEYILNKEQEYNIKLSQRQRQVLYDLLVKGYKLYAICGYAGTGKTTISKIFTDYFKDKYGKDNIKCCAFTGIASHRIHQVTKISSSTIHSLLQLDKGNKFIYNEDKPLEYDLLIVDEASMINLDLFYSLLKAIDINKTNLVFIGDNAQLPPIGAGNVFSDLLRYDWLPKTFLTDIYRQSQESVLVYFANQIRKGEAPENLGNEYKDFSFIKRSFWRGKDLSQKELKNRRRKFYVNVQNKMIEIVSKIIKENNYKPEQAVWDIQIITPMKQGLLGTDELNKIFQNYINFQISEEIKLKENLKLRENDKIIHLKNEYMTVISAENLKSFLDKEKFAGLQDLLVKAEKYKLIERKRIYNGSITIVKKISKNDRMFLSSYNDGSQKYYIFYNFSDFKELFDFGYALTVHKVQGSQFKYIIMPMVGQFFVLLNNKLLYTALTRAVEKIYIVGEEYIFKNACKVRSEQESYTFLNTIFTNDKVIEKNNKNDEKKENIYINENIDYNIDINI